MLLLVFYCSLVFITATTMNVFNLLKGATRLLVVFDATDQYSNPLESCYQFILGAEITF